MADVKRRHATRTLAQSAADREVSLSTLIDATRKAVTAFAFSEELLGYATREEDGALQAHYRKRIDALMAARPGTPLSPPPL